MDVSIVVPVYNASEWLEDALSSVFAQTFTGSLELSVFNDSSTDSSLEVLEAWRARLEARGIRVLISSGRGGPRGTGYGRNQAIQQSSGRYLCFFDADDIMEGGRIEIQHAAALQNANTLLGSCFTRLPPSSTERYTRWANTLTHSQLYTQAFTAFGPTLIQPTWFCSREVFDKSGPFSEVGKGTPEDLLFFHRHLSQGGRLLRLEQSLVHYRYHQHCQSLSVDRWSIWRCRVEALQEAVLSQWSSFTIWNAGKQGRRLYRSLRAQHRAKESRVVAFCDVDHKKIVRGFYTYEESKELPKPRIPIVHFTEARPPLLLCVKWELTGGGFEQNLASLQLTEGRDYYHFS